MKNEVNSGKKREFYEKKPFADRKLDFPGGTIKDWCAWDQYKIGKQSPLGVRSIDSLISDKASGFPVIYVGSKPLIPLDALRAWLGSRVNGHGG